MPGSARSHSASRALRNDTFEVHQGRMTKDGGSITGDCLAELDAVAHRSKMHRVVRRGRPYGERFDVARPETEGDGERGMLFICLNADIAGQFELIQHSWLNNPLSLAFTPESTPSAMWKTPTTR